MPNNRLIVDHSAVFLDAMVLNALAEGGLFRDAAAYLGERMRTTTIVKEETLNSRHVTEPRRQLMQAIEDVGGLLDPSAQQLIEIERAALNASPHEPERNWGEISLVVMARSSATNDVIVLDDYDGQKLARANRIDVATTRELVVEMLWAGACDFNASWRLHSRCWNKRDKRKHDQDMATRVAGLTGSHGSPDGD